MSVRLWNTLLSLGGAALVVFAPLQLSAGKTKCFDEPIQYFKSGAAAKNLHTCRSGRTTKFCSTKHQDYHCNKVNLSKRQKAIPKAVRKQENSDIFAAYLDLMKWPGSVSIQKSMSIQTGKYPEILVNKSLKARCMLDMLQAAYKLQKSFPKYNFVINDRIKSCSNLQKGLTDLLKEQDRVKKNIGRFHSPMHSVFFTNTTKFNHFVMGEMGLYINVDKKNEIRRRLIEFQVGQGQIRHETSPANHVGGFSGWWL